MKKRKLLRNVSLVALSALMVGGTAMAFTGCNKKDPNVLDVFIFCSDADKATNQQIVDAAMDAFNKEYADLLKNKDGTQRTVRAEINNIADTAEYFKQLQQRLQNNEASDVVYISPKYATTYAQQGYVLDLTEYLTGKTDGMSAGATANANEIWGDALALYAERRIRTRRKPSGTIRTRSGRTATRPSASTVCPRTIRASRWAITATSSRAR